MPPSLTIRKHFVRSAPGRGGNTTAWLLGLLCALAVAAAVVVWWRWSPATQPNPDVGQRVVDDFLTQLRDGQSDAAWQTTTAEFKSALGREKFLRFVKERSYFKQPLSFVSMQTVRVQNQPRSEFVYRTADSKATVRVLVGSESGAWHVDRMTADEVAH